MKKYIWIFTIVLFLFFSKDNKCQDNLFIGPIVGLTIPAADYGGNPPDYYTTIKYGQRLGFNFGAAGIFNIHYIALKASVTYSLLGTNGLSDESHGDSFNDVSQRLLTVSLGPQIGINIPRSSFKPHAGVDLLYSLISSSVDFLNTITLSNPTQTIKMNTASRLGIGIAAGTGIKIGRTNLDFSIRYNMINLFGKKYEASANSNRDDVYRFLNDAKDPNYNPNDPNHPVGNDRSISTIQIQLAILFGFKL